MRGASVVGALAVLWGCAHGPVRERVPSEEDREFIAQLYPLAVGNRWTYDTTFLGQKVPASVVEIVREENGYFLHHRTPSANEREKDQGLRMDAFGLRDEKRYLLREPLEPGKTWTNILSPSSAEHYTVLEVGNPCEVPAGRFEGCVRVEGRNRVDEKATLVNEMTFVPKVGLVRVFVWADVKGKRIPQTELKLREFKPAAAPTSPAR